MDLQQNENKYWSSLAQYSEDPQFIENSHKEFLSSPLQTEAGLAEKSDDGFNRRDFMKLMAASTALASGACIQRPMRKILPYVNQPEEVTFGVANFYASTCIECAANCGILVKTREGRPIKLEGNPDHPMSKGGLCARGQASILNLYDPDRLRNPITVKRGTTSTSPTTWEKVDAELAAKLKEIKSKGGRVRILTETVTSPSTQMLLKDFLGAFSHGELVVYDPISAESIIEGQELSYGSKVLPRYRFDQAEVVVSIDADFLGTWISPVEFTKQFTKNRKVTDKHKKMSKLIAFESMMTVTGANADERAAIRPQDAASVALALAHELVLNLKVGSADAETQSVLKSYSPHSVSAQIGCNEKLLTLTAKTLAKAKGKSLVVAGSSSTSNEEALSLQVAVNLLNSVLQNDGTTVDYGSSPSLQRQGGLNQVTKLVKDLEAGQVDALLIWRANPAYNLAKSLGFAAAAKKAGVVVSFNDRADETSEYCDYVLPDNHSLESWGDAQPQKDLYSLVQPTIRPIYSTRSFQESLLSFNKLGALGAASLSKAPDWHEYVQNYWHDVIYKEYGVTGSFVSFWETALRDGVFDGASKRGARTRTLASRTFKSSALKAHLPAKPADGMTMVAYPQVALFDGRNANNPWLQELPDPITRVVWDNYASVSPKTAEKLLVKDGDVFSVKVGSDALELPVHVQPGLHDKVVAVALGYGRTATGQVGSGIGTNLFALGPVSSGRPVSLTKTGAKFLLSSIQDQNSLQGRAIIKEASLKEYEESSFAGNEEKEELTTLWSSHEYNGYRWAMAIDLNSCTGCNACVVGCQSENNIPVVGKEGVARGRIMHWIRIDRYYTGTPDNPKVVHQPMLCQHCENAPCETVCPVVATTHDSEGINQQTYNRCVGTRYCANNCPYKVRRFNWFDYNYGGQNRYPSTLAQNPEVTVRSRGVMEKCSFCIQRIHDAKNKAKDMGRNVKDGELQTACQQSCPADAIVFGNINDVESAVTKAAKDPRGFHVLEELNVRPSITYMTKIRNTENV